MPWENPFHEGELKAQQMAGEVREGESNGDMIGNKIMSGALNFIRAQKWRSSAAARRKDAAGHRCCLERKVSWIRARIAGRW